jgi:hypothetical protein
MIDGILLRMRNVARIPPYYTHTIRRALACPIFSTNLR